MHSQSVARAPMARARPVGSSSKAKTMILSRSRPFFARRPVAAAVSAESVPAAAGSSSSSSSSNGTSSSGKPAGATPTPAETARTIVDLADEGALCCVHAGDGAPLGAPVTYRLDADGQPIVLVNPNSPEGASLARGDARVCLLVRPATLPARRVASVSLRGAAKPHVSDEGDAGAAEAAQFKLHVDECVCYGGLDQTAGAGLPVSGDAYRAAEPDALRHAAAALVGAWNDDRAEDVYRIVAAHLGAPVTEMAYAELLWVDRLGMYVLSELAGGGDASGNGSGGASVVRVPFLRPVLDERDARSAITMAAQLAWESERAYVPAPPALFQDAASN